jgi:hypothetical protein
MTANITLDDAHQNMMTMYYKHDTKTIPQLTEELCKLKEQLENKKSNIDDYMEIKDKIRDNAQKIKSLKNDKKKYLLQNAKDIFFYFEEKQKISKGMNFQNTNTLNTFFKIKSTNDTEINADKYTQSKKQYRYWKNINMQELGPSLKGFIYSYDVCLHCGNGEMIHQDEEGVLICNNTQCGHFMTFIIEGSKPSNKEPPNEVSYTAYIRLNHFKEILSQFQAKETTHIPPEVIQAIRDRICKERIDIRTQLNSKLMRELLRKLKFNKYFEHIQYINSIIGIQPPYMDDKLIETLCVLFIEIQQPWALYCPPDRVNFFNYSYILHQLCVLLGQKQYLPFITLLKNDAKQKQQDDIWKFVCRDLDWQFFATV